MQRSVFEFLEVDLLHDVISGLVILVIYHDRPVLGGVKPLLGFVLQFLDLLVLKSFQLHLFVLGQRLDNSNFTH